MTPDADATPKPTKPATSGKKDHSTQSERFDRILGYIPLSSVENLLLLRERISSDLSRRYEVAQAAAEKLREHVTGIEQEIATVGGTAPSGQSGMAIRWRTPSNQILVRELSKGPRTLKQLLDVAPDGEENKLFAAVKRAVQMHAIVLDGNVYRKGPQFMRGEIPSIFDAETTEPKVRGPGKLPRGTLINFMRTTYKPGQRVTPQEAIAAIVAKLGMDRKVARERISSLLTNALRNHEDFKRVGKKGSALYERIK